MMTDLPLPYRLRSDVEWTPIQGHRRHWWVAKDPMRSILFRCGDEVRRLLQSLDGRRSIQDLQQSLSQGVSGQRISRQSIHSILRAAIQKQLLVPIAVSSKSATSPLGLDSTAPKNSLTAWLRVIQQSPWSIIQGKHRLGNAEGLLQKLSNRTDWLFSDLAVRFWITFVFASMVLVLAKASSQNLSILPSISAISDHTVQWFVILMFTRIAHELGHAIVCVRMGARCREYGLFFTLGIAFPYVDVTDSWRLSSPKDRMAVAAAGIYVEWILAGIAGLIWYFSQPGWLHLASWQIMWVCSLTTLLINANPLMRYDGYFLLSDYLEVVNLREDSDAACSRLTRRWWLGRQATIDERYWSWQDTGLIAYSCLSRLYRCCLIASLIGSVHTLCSEWQVPRLGWMFTALMLISFVVIPMSQKMFQSWIEARRVPRGPVRLVVMWLGCAALIANLGWLPLPNRVACQGIVQPESHTIVYTQAAGRIPIFDSLPSEFGTHETQTSQSVLLALENPWIEDRARLAMYRQKQIECKMTSTRMAAYQDPSLIDRLPTLSTIASIAKKQTSHAITDVKSLIVESPAQATWIPLELPTLESLDGSKSPGRLQTIEDPACLGQWLPAGTPIGYVTESDRVSISATISISKLDDIDVGMPARVRFEQLPSQVYTGKIIGISGMAATPDDSLRRQLWSYRLPNNDSPDATSLVSISLSVEGVSQKMLGMGGTVEVVVWSNPKSLYHQIVHLAGATFGPSGLQTISR